MEIRNILDLSFSFLFTCGGLLLLALAFSVTVDTIRSKKNDKD